MINVATSQTKHNWVDLDAFLTNGSTTRTLLSFPEVPPSERSLHRIAVDVTNRIVARVWLKVAETAVTQRALSQFDFFGHDVHDDLAAEAIEQVNILAARLARMTHKHVQVLALCPDNDMAYCRRLERDGFAPALHWYDMETAPATVIGRCLTGQSADVQILPYSREYEREVWGLHLTSFADDWGSLPESLEEWRTQYAECALFSHDCSFVAKSGSSVVAYVLSFMHPESSNSTVSIEYLATAVPSRGRGIARALLCAVAVAAHERNIERLELTVKASSSNAAIALYRDVGFHVSESTTTFAKAVGTEC